MRLRKQITEAREENERLHTVLAELVDGLEEVAG